MITTQSADGRNVANYQNVLTGVIESDFQFDPSRSRTVEHDVLLARGGKFLGNARVGKRSPVATYQICVGILARIQPRAILMNVGE
jgi:6-phosphofructokinase